MKRKSLFILVIVWAGTLAAAYWSGLLAGKDGPTRAPWSKNDLSPAARAAAPGGSDAAASGSPSSPWSKPRDDAQGAKGSADQDAVLARIKASLANPNAILRSQEFLAALGQLDEEGLQNAATWMLENREGMDNRWQFSLLMYAWGRKAPEQALAWAMEKKEGRAAFSVLSSWAQASPDKAIAWAQANAPVRDDGTPGDNWHMLGVINGLASTDIGRATKAVEGMNFGEARGRALDMVLDQLWRRDPQAAQKWVTSLEDERLRSGAAGKVAGRLVGQDVRQAAAWTEGLADLASKGRAATEVIDRWTRDDPDSAGEWLNRFPKSVEMDAARERFAYGIDERDPMSSLAWAQTITDTGRREETLRRISQDWLRRDNPTAKAYLQQQPNLPERVRRMIR